jgi:hypothetical protein
VTGPYIVTTKRRPPAAAYVRGLGVRPRADVLSRRAVATLDGAKRYAISDNSGAWVNEPREGKRPDDWQAALDAILALPESGGTVGPLPDGTIIEVEATKYKRLRALLDAEARRHVDHAPDPEAWKQRILDAYNARE